MTTLYSSQSIDYFFNKFSEGHSKIDPSFKGSTFEYVMESINIIDGMKVNVIVQSSVYKINEVLTVTQRRDGRKPQMLINHGMSYRIEWKYYDHLLYDWNILCKVKSPLGLRVTIGKLLTHLHKNLPCMHINKYTGRFNSVEVCEGFGDSYLTEDSCCVCLDKTMTKTTCNHSVCIECSNHMRITSPNRDLVCPLCRDTFIIRTNDTDTDEDSIDDSTEDTDDESDGDSDEENDILNHNSDANDVEHDIVNHDSNEMNVEEIDEDAIVNLLVEIMS